MSTCTVFTLGLGTDHARVVRPPVRVPTKITKSASLTAVLAVDREYSPTTPTESGSSSSMALFALRDVATGARSLRASSASSTTAPEVRIPPPATMIGRFAFKMAR